MSRRRRHANAKKPQSKGLMGGHTLWETFQAHPIASAMVATSIVDAVRGDHTHKGPRQSHIQKIGRLRRYLVGQGYSHEEVDRFIRAARSGRYASMSKRKRSYPASRLGPNAYPIRGRAYYVVDIRRGKVVAGPFSPVGKADRHLARHYNSKTHQVIDGRYLTKHAFGNAMTERRAHIIRESGTRFERAREAHDPKRYKRGGGYTPEEYQAIARKAGLSRPPSNRARAALEHHWFMTEKPERVFAYYDRGMRHVTLWSSKIIGDITSKGAIVHRRGVRTQSVRVRGYNGVWYHGIANLDTGTYVRLRAMKGTRTRSR